MRRRVDFIFIVHIYINLFAFEFSEVIIKMIGNISALDAE